RASTTISSTTAAAPPLARTPGTSQNVSTSTTKLVTPLRTSDLAQARVGRHERARRSPNRIRLRTTLTTPATPQDWHRGLTIYCLAHDGSPRRPSARLARRVAGVTGSHRVHRRRGRG